MNQAKRANKEEPATKPAVEECDTDTDQQYFNYLKKTKPVKQDGNFSRTEIGTTNNSRLDSTAISMAVCNNVYDADNHDLKLLLQSLRIKDDLEGNMVRVLRTALLEVLD